MKKLEDNVRQIAQAEAVKLSTSDVDNVESGLKQPPQKWIVAAVLLLALLVTSLLYLFKPEAEKLPVKAQIPVVDYVLASSGSIALPVVSQGTIKAKTHIKLVSEVSGRVAHLAKLELNGGFFKKGELLLSIDDTDYRLAITKAEALVSSARQQLARVEAEAAQARYDLKQIGRKPSSTSDYALRVPHLAEARANLKAAKADLEIARLQLQRTQIRAPFNGRVVSKQVDVGQFVSPGSVLADIYSTDAAEVRLPLSLRQTELLGLDLRDNRASVDKVSVSLNAQYSGQHYQWPAQLSHTEGELDARNRLVYVVAKVADPYGLDASELSGESAKESARESVRESVRPPLTPGMFVKARFSGVSKDNTIRLPRQALRYGGEVWLVDQQGRLKKSPVELHTKDQHMIYVKSGISDGDKVIISAIDYAIEGMSLTLGKQPDE